MSSSSTTNVVFRTHARANFARLALTLTLVSALGCAQGGDAEIDALGAESALKQSTNADTHTCKTEACPAQSELDLSRLHIETRAIAAQVGHYATPARGQEGALNGSDLGWTFAHRDKLWVMFGDSWWIDPFNLISQPDDALGQISLADFPDGPSVDAFVREHPAPRGAPAWHAAGPTMNVFLRRGQKAFAPVIAERDGRAIPSGVAFVPMTGFSNGRDDAGEGVFAIFFSYEHVPCVLGQCRGGYECDLALGTELVEWLNPPCLVGTSLTCSVGPGFCQDRSSSIYDPTSAMGRTQATVVRHDVGVTTAKDPIHFKTQAWDTQRFFNVTSRTVTDFDPHRVRGAGNDYKPALGNDLERAGVFVWGRPQFGGIGTDGRDAQLYLLWSPMPVPDQALRFEWKPQYFTGISAEGQPLFSTRELDAQPLDLDAETFGIQPEESQDVVGQMNISWVPSLQRWVMFYGGDVAPMFAKAIFRDDLARARRNPDGSLYVRFAEHPWGPWTRPQQLMAAGNSDPRAAATGQYAPGGLLAHNNCPGLDCARYDPAYLADVTTSNNGVLYAPSIIDQWTTVRDDVTDLYWFVSTWNPYQVVLMKSSLSIEE